MPNVWFVGGNVEIGNVGGQRVISRQDWASHGIDADTVTWNSYNGWSLPHSMFSSDQLAILQNDHEFLLGQEGPRLVPQPKTLDEFYKSGYIYYKRIKDFYDQLVDGDGDVVGPQGPVGEKGDTGVAGPVGPAGPPGPGTVIVYEGNGAPMRPATYHIEDYGADPTGVNDSNQALLDAYAALNGKPGQIVFGVGLYKLYVGLNESVGRLLKPGQGVIGQGSGLSRIDFRGNGSFLEFRDKDFFDNSKLHDHGGCHGLQILGWNNANSNICGVRYGDMWRMRMSDVEISGFATAGGKGLWGDNQVAWSERAIIECTAIQCSTGFLFESSTGDMSSGSFDYSQYKLSFVAQPNQHAFVLQNATDASRASMNGAELTITGNCQLASVGGTNNGVLFRVGRNDADTSSFSGTLSMGVETSGTVGGTAHYDFMQGSGEFWQINSRVSASGTINLIPYSGTNFQRGNASARTFAFGGMLKGSPALGSTGTVQSFQSLQLVSQSRGGYFLDATNAVQNIYITQATGGVFKLWFGGYSTVDLPYNATASAIESALSALPSIGSGNVWVYSAQGRYFNSVAMDEIGFVVGFQNALASTDVPLITATYGGLTGSSPSVTILQKAPGSPNPTYTIYLEHGSIFTLDPPPGTYRIKIAIGGLTAMPGDSPFGVNTVDVWLKQPDSGGPAIWEPPFFVPSWNSGSTYNFKWFDGVEPVFSTEPGYWDIIRLTSYNFNVWVGQHLTKQATTTVPAPATPTSPGIKGQIAYDSSYSYTCIAPDTWKRSPLTSW